MRTDTVIMAKHENDGGGEEGGKAERFSSPRLPLSRIVFSVQLNLRTTNEEHTKKPLYSVPRQCFFFSRDCILFVVGRHNYVIYFKNLTSQEPTRNFCTTAGTHALRTERNASDFMHIFLKRLHKEKLKTSPLIIKKRKHSIQVCGKRAHETVW